MEKISVIVPIKNLKMITKVCIDSIKKYTSNYELILIDDGSDIETKHYLEEEVKDCLIRNDKSVGWCKAINQGSKVATGDYIVYLNNDVVVTPGWAEKLKQVLKKDPNIGILGCTTNRVEGYQHIRFNKPGVGFQYVDALTGFCLMMPRKTFDELYKKDGFWMDERFGLGGMDDVDICIRIKKLGYKIGLARNVFIYHYGSATFREEMNMEESQKYAKEKVGILFDKYKDDSSINIDREKRQYKEKEPMETTVDKTDTVADKPKIMIAIPTLGSIRPELCEVLFRWAKHPKYDVHLITLKGQLPLDNARSQVVKRFLEITNNDDDRLWFIDDDIVPPVDSLDKLYHHNKDVCGALCFMMKHDDSGTLVPMPIGLRYNEDKKYEVFYGGKGLTEVDAIGGGCIMVKRKVFEDIKGRMYQFHYYPDGTLKLVGDFHFCQKVQEAGYKIYVDYGCLCDHIKPVGLKGVNDLMVKISNNK